MGFETPCSLTKNKLGRIPYGYDPSGQHETYNSFSFIFYTYFLIIILFPRWLLWDISVTVGLRENTINKRQLLQTVKWLPPLLFRPRSESNPISFHTQWPKEWHFFSNKIDTPVIDARMGLQGQPMDSGSKGILSLGRYFELVRKVLRLVVSYF